MSKYQHQTLHAPAGVDLLTDPPSIMETRASHIEGFFPGRAGCLIPSYPLKSPIPGRQLPGDAGYFGPSSISVLRSIESVTRAEQQAGRTTKDLYVGLDGMGALRYANLKYGDNPGVPGRQEVSVILPWLMPQVSQWVEFSNVEPYPATSIFHMVQAGPELLIVALAGSPIYSFYVHPITRLPTLVRLGLAPPPQPVAVPTAGGSLTPSSLYSYALTVEDPFGRESPLSPSFTVQTGSSTPRAFRITFPQVTQRQRVWENMHLYRTLAGGGIYYRIRSATRAQVQVGLTHIDTQADSTVAAGVIGPAPGANLPPRPSTFFAIHKNRLWATIEGEYIGGQYENWVRAPASRASIQVSNLENFAAYSRAETLAVGVSGANMSVTDGAELVIDIDSTDPVTGIISAGAACCVWKRYGMWLVWGDDPTTFSIQLGHRVGCVAPRTVCNFAGNIVWRGPDGIYTTSGASGFAPRILSQMIEPVFRREYPWLRLATNA